MNGVLNIFKPKGMSSFDVVRIVRKVACEKKVGHTGTLDPEAIGVLPVCLGKATKIIDYIMNDKKSYKVKFKLGVTTTTYDLEGEIYLFDSLNLSYGCGAQVVTACEMNEENKSIEEILKKLWSLLDISVPLSIMQMKIYTLALFSLLQNLKEIPPSQACTFFTETQVDIAKRVEKIITSDLRQHHPAWELAAQFSISETSLKNYFRGVFGQNISVYLRETRMKKAAELLSTTKLSVAEAAEQVGYINQSKFASVFKKQFGLSPLEYRRAKTLEKS